MTLIVIHGMKKTTSMTISIIITNCLKRDIRIFTL